MIRRIGYLILALFVGITTVVVINRRALQLGNGEAVSMVCRMPEPLNDESVLANDVEDLERWRVKTKEEAVVFYVLREEHSNEHIARRGILVTRPGARATVLVMHGYTSGKTDMGVLRLIFPKHNIFLFDFRAHGEDIEGQMSTFGYDEVFDVFAAVDFLRTRAETKKLPLIGYGFSMGAATAIEAQARDPHLFSALILDCPFDSSDNIIRRGLDQVMGSIHIPFINAEMPVPGKTFLQKYAFHPYVRPLLFFLLRVFAGMDASRVPTSPKKIAPIESVCSVKIPTFFIACYADDRVPLDAVLGIYAHAGGFKRLWITKGVRHYGSIFNNPELYQHMVTTFIDKILDGRFQTEPRGRIMNEVSQVDAVTMHDRLFGYALPAPVVSFLYPQKQG